MSTPQSTIYVCSGVRLDSRYTHTIFFDSRVEQRAYFMGKVVKQFSTYSYIRKSWNLKLQATMEQARTWNYLFFHNGENAKWYYYFINNIEYVNDNTVELFLEMDVMQTYLPTTGSEALDYRLLPCFVERQHVDSDEIGEHTVDENLELGELINNGHYVMGDSELTNLCVMIQSTVNPQTGSKHVGSRIHGVFSGIGVYAVSMEYWDDFAVLLADFDKDAIVTMWMYPKSLVTLVSGENWDDSQNIIHPVGGVNSVYLTTQKNMEMDGYEDSYGGELHNKKLYTYPYNFLYVSNNNGVSAAYRYERFNTELCEFKVSGAISPDASVRLDPEYYDGVSINFEQGMSLDGFPTCAWNADAYKIWLAQNQNQNKLAFATAGLTIAGGAVAAVAGLATGNMVAGSAGASLGLAGANQIASMLAQQKDLQLQPPQAKGGHSTNVNVALQKHCFIAYFKSINKEHVKILDDYFDMYGYRLNQVKVPRLNARVHFTYVKTIGCCIRGGLCNEDITKIESIFDKGITFWKDGDAIGEYGISNSNLPVGN